MKKCCFFCGRYADRSNAKPCPGTTFRGGDLQVRIGKSWIQDSKYLDQGLIDVDCQTILMFHSLRSGDRAGYSDQSCFVAFSVGSFVIPIDLGMPTAYLHDLSGYCLDGIIDQQARWRESETLLPCRLI